MNIPNIHHSTQKKVFLILLATAICYLGYFLDRNNFTALVIAFSLAFIGYLGVALNPKHAPVDLWIGMGLRALLLLSIPSLSDDYFRFVWDGLISASGHNPFAMLPSAYLAEGAPQIEGISQSLYKNLNSQQYFTIYPPICQLVFYIAATLGKGLIWKHVLVLRLSILIAEGVTLYLLKRLLEYYQQKPSLIRWYAFNPLVIIELSGNLHFEAWMITGILCGLYGVVTKKNWLIILGLSIGIQSKLLPLMLLPSLLPLLGWKKAFYTYAAVIGFLLIGLAPFIDETTIQNFSSSLDLYFRRFEFNASLYYIIRWIGYQIIGYNIIQWAGPTLSIAVLLVILVISFFPPKNNSSFPSKWMWIFTAYLTGATIVHPWYILILIPLGLLTCYRFPVLWSFTILGSYAAYQTEAYAENLYLVGSSYGIVMIYALWEIRQKSLLIS